MTAYDFTDKTKTYFAPAPDHTSWEHMLTIKRNIVDFAKQNLVASDTATVLDLPADTIVWGLYVRTITADASAQVELLINSTSVVTTSSANLASADDAIGKMLTEPTILTTAGHVKLKAESTLDTLKVEVVALCTKAIDAL